MKRLLSKLYSIHFWRNMSEKYNFLIQAYIYIYKCKSSYPNSNTQEIFKASKNKTFLNGNVIRLKSFNCKHSLNKYFAECVGFYLTVVSLYNGETFVCYSCIQDKPNMEQLFIQKENIFFDKTMFPLQLHFYA